MGHRSLITEGKMLNKATSGRKRLQMLSDITNKEYENTKREAKCKSSWQKKNCKFIIISLKTERKKLIKLINQCDRSG